MAAERLGKGLKGSELFKKTENIEPDKSESANTQMSKSPKAQNHINTTAQEVRKHFVLPGDLADRLRAFCFSRREKEARAVRQALELFLKQEGF